MKFYFFSILKKLIEKQQTIKNTFKSKDCYCHNANDRYGLNICKLKEKQTSSRIHFSIYHCFEKKYYICI